MAPKPPMAEISQEKGLAAIMSARAISKVPSASTSVPPGGAQGGDGHPIGTGGYYGRRPQWSYHQGRTARYSPGPMTTARSGPTLTTSGTEVERQRRGQRARDRAVPGRRLLRGCAEPAGPQRRRRPRPAARPGRAHRPRLARSSATPGRGRRHGGRRRLHRARLRLRADLPKRSRGPLHRRRGRAPSSGLAPRRRRLCRLPDSGRRRPQGGKRARRRRHRAVRGVAGAGAGRRRSRPSAAQPGGCRRERGAGGSTAPGRRAAAATGPGAARRPGPQHLPHQRAGRRGPPPDRTGARAHRPCPG